MVTTKSTTIIVAKALKAVTKEPRANLPSLKNFTKKTTKIKAKGMNTHQNTRGCTISKKRTAPRIKQNIAMMNNLRVG